MQSLSDEIFYQGYFRQRDLPRNRSLGARSSLFYTYGKSTPRYGWKRKAVNLPIFAYYLRAGSKPSIPAATDLIRNWSATPMSGDNSDQIR